MFVTSETEESFQKDTQSHQLMLQLGTTFVKSISLTLTPEKLKMLMFLLPLLNLSYSDNIYKKQH